ncbi:MULTISPECIES: ATP-grasp domain-containing protein [Streptomyces]|uniref:ATP-grasp domain-containing protein n=1 Tax=Streptomyces TaxID=1883 RepID=UPI001E5CC5CA|nr:MULTISPECIES: ATP-grasp domain-containing protein [Streptomyces]UFQ17169.1 ATP-grasp domain-containing protein [Streptomyces huasconensis]WCL86769.1 ATP-grasp domain-containing protein [Streptomyces sp. JCM 35825]
MSSTPPVAAIVDGYSTGNFLPAAFTRLGAQVVHVRSTPEWMTSMLLPDMDSYVGDLVFHDEEQIVKELGPYNVSAVLAGQEPGVPLSDRLSELVGTVGNGSRLSAARRDKYQMIEVLREAGLRCADQLKSSDPQALVDWAEERGEYPVVIKPLSSASTDGVFICGSAQEVRSAAEEVLASRDIFDLPNREVLIQSYLDGEEYIVDTVSHDGHRFVCGVWKYEKTLTNGKNVYDKDVLMPADASPVPELIAYVDEVLKAMNIRFGPTHTEVKMTSDGPALVEIGARLNGNMHPDFHQICLGHNQADLIALSYLRPEEFLRRYGDGVYTRRQPAVVYNAPSVQEGEVRAIDEDVVREIAALPTVFLPSVKVKPGGRVRRTVDLLTSPLRIFMTGVTDEAVLTDYRKIQELKDKVYLL